jgi:hypothetical protein
VDTRAYMAEPVIRRSDQCPAKPTTRGAYFRSAWLSPFRGPIIKSSCDIKADQGTNIAEDCEPSIELHTMSLKQNNNMYGAAAQYEDDAT